VLRSTSSREFGLRYRVLPSSQRRRGSRVLTITVALSGPVVKTTMAHAPALVPPQLVHCLVCPKTTSPHFTHSQSLFSSSIPLPTSGGKKLKATWPNATLAKRAFQSKPRFIYPHRDHRPPIAKPRPRKVTKQQGANCKIPDFHSRGLTLNRTTNTCLQKKKENRREDTRLYKNNCHRRIVILPTSSDRRNQQLKKQNKTKTNLTVRVSLLAFCLVELSSIIIDVVFFAFGHAKTIDPYFVVETEKEKKPTVR
jgi:hypothetical protein